MKLARHPSVAGTAALAMSIGTVLDCMTWRRVKSLVCSHLQVFLHGLHPVNCSSHAFSLDPMTAIPHFAVMQVAHATAYLDCSLGPSHKGGNGDPMLQVHSWWCPMICMQLPFVWTAPHWQTYCFWRAVGAMLRAHCWLLWTLAPVQVSCSFLNAPQP